MRKLELNKIFILIIYLFGILNANSIERWHRLNINPSPVICYAFDKIEKSFVSFLSDVLKRLKSAQSPKSDIRVTYSLFPANAKAAFEYAVSLWENIIESPVPIYMQANWRTKSSGILGSCGANSFFANFKYAPYKNRFYTSTIVEKITKKEITGPGEPDMTAEFNKNANWYFGTDGKTPDSLYDFVSVVMHEIGHGLGFTGFFTVSGDVGFYARSELGEASSFDIMVLKNQVGPLVDTLLFKNSSASLKSALISGDLFVNSPVAVNDGGGLMPRLYVPQSWDGGSSVYHLNDNTYLAGTPNSLMTHAIGKGEAIHDPGPLARGILEDTGWKSMYVDFVPVKDSEVIKPILFSCRVESDYPLNKNSMYIYISKDGFSSQKDSVKLISTVDPLVFTAGFSPPTKGTYSYYLSIPDSKQRIFKYPAEAPKTLYKFVIGSDLTPPAIEHIPVQFFLNNGKKPEIVVHATDNIGIDTVYVEYSINGVSQPSFGLFSKVLPVYKGFFNFEPLLLKDGDLITYKIVSKDVSEAKNSTIFPADKPFSFKVEQIYPPIRGYINDFNNPTLDFITNDFSIKTVTGFNDGALHSAHPYPSPKKDTTYWNFSAILKRPIILVSNSTMSFDEVVLVEPGENGAVFGSENFWDYVIVEGSKDKGNTWKPLADGYDSRFNQTWFSNYNLNIIDQSSSAVGIKEWFITHNFKPFQNGNFAIGDIVLFRFRLYSDPYANGWGWVIDNLRIQFPVPAGEIHLSSQNFSVYPNPFQEDINISVNLPGNTGNLMIEIYNVYGQKLKSINKGKVFGAISEKINLNDFAPGIYLIIAKEEGNVVFSEKIIRQN